MTDTEKELEFHIEMQTRRYVDAGLDPVAGLGRLGRGKALHGFRAAPHPHPDPSGLTRAHAAARCTS